MPDVCVQIVDSPVMIQFSYRAMSNRIENPGFEFKGNLRRGIGDTIRLLKALANGRIAVAMGTEL